VTTPSMRRTQTAGATPPIRTFPLSEMFAGIERTGATLVAESVLAIFEMGCFCIAVSSSEVNDSTTYDRPSPAIPP
jgi:hypothetical protein